MLTKLILNHTDDIMFTAWFLHVMRMGLSRQSAHCTRVQLSFACTAQELFFM